MLVHQTLSLILSTLLLLAALPLPAADTAAVDARRHQLKQLLADDWEYELRESPEQATIIGDYRYNDRWSNASVAHVAESRRDIQQWLAKFEAVDTSGFPEQEKLNQSL